MALALTVDKIDSVPEAMRGAYVEKDGKFHLDVDGLEDTTGLKNTVAALRTERDTFKSQISEWAKLGKKPEEVDAMMQAERQKAEEALLKAGKFDQVLSTKLGEAKQEAEKLIGAEKQRAESALAVARRAIVDTGLSTALAKAKATPEGLAALPKLLAERVKVEFNDAHEAVHSIFDADGKTPLFSDGGKPASFDDLVKGAMKVFPSLFEGTGGGGGASSKSRTTGTKEISRTDFDKLGPFEQAAKVREGFKVVE